MASAVDERRLISPYRKLLNQLSDQLTREELEKLKLLSVDHIPRGKAEHIQSGLQFFDLLEQDSKIHQRDLALLEDMFNTIGRMDIVSTICTFSSHQKDEASLGALADPLPLHENEEVPDAAEGDPNNKPLDRATVSQIVESPPLIISSNGVPTFACDGDNVITDGVGDDLSDGHQEGQRVKATTAPTVQAELLSRGLCLASKNANGQHGKASDHMCSMSAGAGTNEVLEGAMARVGACDPVCPEVQHDLYSRSSSMRYVDFMEFQGYAVQIIGGKHFKTPEGEFVEMKSGVQYKIHVTNTHPEACNLDISIDGYDVGGWVLQGNEDLIIERPASEAKRFTFYRVKTAPKEAGIESGRSENGVIRCVFTPEAHMSVSVDVCSLRQTLQVNLPPSATVGDLKREVQRRLNTDDDSDQVIVQDNRQLSNDFPLSRHLRLTPAKNLRLLDTELNISIEPSSGAKFLIKVHPGKARIRDVMQHIEEAIRVPVKDQKLYHGRSRLSDFPGERIPVKLICDVDPVLVVMFPEYLHITVKTQDGSTNTVNIDQKKTLRDLLEEIPLGQTLAENEEAEFVFEGKQLNPYSENGSLQSYNIRSESTLEVVKTSFIVFQVRLPDCSTAVDVKMSPEATFKDLVTRLKKENKESHLEGIKFAKGERILDPDQQKEPIQDYGVEDGSYLVARSRDLEGVPPLSENKERLLDLKSRKLEEKSGKSSVQHSASAGVLGSVAGLAQRFVRRVQGLFTLGYHREPGEEKKGHYSGRRLPPSYGDSEGLFLPSKPRSKRPSRRAVNTSRRAVNIPRKVSQSSPLSNESEEKFCLRPMNEYPAAPADGASANSCGANSQSSSSQSGPASFPGRRVTQKDPAWKSGGTTLQGNSRQMFAPAEPIKVDCSRKVELLLRLVAREDEEVGMFPDDECKPLSTLYPSAVPE